MGCASRASLLKVWPRKLAWWSTNMLPAAWISWLWPILIRNPEKPNKLGPLAREFYTKRYSGG